MNAIDTIINALKSALPSLSLSTGTIERKMIDVFGSVADTYRRDLSDTKNAISRALAEQRITTRDYYRRRAVEFQIDDELKYDPVTFLPYYEKVDGEKRIIKQAYIIGEFPNYTIIVNTVDKSTGMLRALTKQELASFTTYFSAFLPLGLELTAITTPPASITDPDITLYVSTGTDATKVADDVNKALRVYEQTLRKTNTVTRSEIEDVMQSVPGVVAVGWASPTAIETHPDGSETVTSDVKGVFPLETGAFVFGTEITVDKIKTLS